MKLDYARDVISIYYCDVINKLYNSLSWDECSIIYFSLNYVRMVKKTKKVLINV